MMDDEMRGTAIMGLLLLLATLPGCRVVARYTAAPADGGSDAPGDGSPDHGQDARSDVVGPFDGLQRDGSEDSLTDSKLADSRPPLDQRADTTPSDLLANDNGVITGMACQGSNKLTGVAATLMADTVISALLPPQGDELASFVGGVDNAAALLRFRINTPANALTAPLAFKLRLYPTLWAQQCGLMAGCSACTLYEVSGFFALRLATSSWSELDATWAKPRPFPSAWQTAGALGPKDSSAPLAAALFHGGQPDPLIFDSITYPALLTTASQWSDASNDELSFRVSTLGPGRMALRLESTQLPCSGMQTKVAELTTWFCVPGP